IYDLSRGFDSLEETLGKINAELYLVSFEKDLLFLPSEMETIVTTMHAIGKENVDYFEVESDYGHDAFLVEIDKINQYVKDAL
ncbi:MAG: homoserine O-acetyltransferase, partial [Sulfuricurvum sp.]